MSGGKPRRAAAVMWAAMALMAASCAAVPPSHQATGDILAFLRALQNRDMGGIERGIDREALSRQSAAISRAVLAGESERLLGNGILGSVVGELAGPVVALVGPVAVQPEFLAEVAERAGLREDTRLPGRFAAGFFLRSLPDGRVCAPDPRRGQCLMFFTNSASGWRLTAIDEATLRDRIARGG